MNTSWDKVSGLCGLWTIILPNSDLFTDVVSIWFGTTVCHVRCIKWNTRCS